MVRSRKTKTDVPIGLIAGFDIHPASGRHQSNTTRYQCFFY
ncbi:MAG: hypothetical protein GKR93_10090 [Gammaproteobacteria bacterium]|nr:hypothetical protein [Gammaproteobacteria bacterium]